MNLQSRKSDVELLNAANTAIRATIADEQCASTMEILGYSKAALEEGKRRYEAAANALAVLTDAEEMAKEAARNKQAVAKKALRRASVERDKALKALREWLTPYIKIASIAFEGNNDVLDKLGIARNAKPVDTTKVPVRPDSQIIDIRKESKVTKPIAFVPVMPSVCASAVATPSTSTNTTALKPGPNLALL
jgi:hypothetical protein